MVTDGNLKCLREALSSTAGVTGKRGMWRKKPPDAESAVWGRFPESAANGPHLSGARGVGQILQDDFEFDFAYFLTSIRRIVY